MKTHQYFTTVEWTGNSGSGTAGYTSYERDHIGSGKGKNHTIEMASDPAFRGDKTRYNPEELLVMSLSSCHMLWYLHLCSKHGIVVTKYLDNANGEMAETQNGGGHFVSVTLNPEVTIDDDSKTELAHKLHEEANQLCFIAKSCNFPVHHKPTIHCE